MPTTSPTSPPMYVTPNRTHQVTRFIHAQANAVPDFIARGQTIGVASITDTGALGVTRVDMDSRIAPDEVVLSCTFAAVGVGHGANFVLDTDFVTISKLDNLGAAVAIAQNDFFTLTMGRVVSV